MRENFVLSKLLDLTLGIGCSLCLFSPYLRIVLLFHSVFNSFKNKKTTLDKLIEKNEMVKFILL